MSITFMYFWPAFCHAANKRRLIDWLTDQFVTCVLVQNHNTHVLNHNIQLAEMHARFDRAHSRVVDAENELVRLDAELAAKTVMFGNIVT